MVKRVFVLILVVAVLVIGGNAFAHIPDPPLGPEWKLVYTGSNSGSTFYVNTRRITYLPGGIVKVRTLFVPRGEFRRKLVNDLNNDKKFWYTISLEKFNCKTHQSALLELDAYSFGQALLFSHSSQHEKWEDFDPGSPDAKVEKYVCKGVPLSIPNPSLGPEWKLVFKGSDGSKFYVNTRRITYLPGGIVKEWDLVVPRGELRRTLVNDLKHNLLSEGKDPNNAKRLWYIIFLGKVNCKTHQNAPLEEIDYSFERVDLYSHSFQHEKWYRIVPGSEGEVEEKYVCNETPLSIPEPSLSSEWKLVGRGSNSGSTFYFNTRSVTYSPKGIVKFWELWVPRGELRRENVNISKNNLLSEGKDPNNAKRLWYIKSLIKFNCKTHQYAKLEDIAYSFGQAVLDDDSYQHEVWKYIPTGSVGEAIEKYVCKSTK